MTTPDDEQHTRPRIRPDHRSRPRIRRVREPEEVSNVGYRRPPREHQFQPGHSGNPRGRPRGSKNESTILAEILARKIDNRSGGRVRKITVLEGILLRVVNDSLQGNTKSATFLLNRYAAMVSGELQRTDLSQDDREVLNAFAERLDTRRANRGDGR